MFFLFSLIWTLNSFSQVTEKKPAVQDIFTADLETIETFRPVIRRVQRQGT
jgi:hypothetical protein